MENASKALIIAAEVLIGVIILSVGATLFIIFSDYSKSTVAQIEETKITEFNAKFLKYDNKEVTAHDIISIANLARENNFNYELENQDGYDKNTYYIQVDVKSVKSKLEKVEDENYKNNFINNNTLVYGTDGKPVLDSDGQPLIKKYICKVQVSLVTKRVMYVEFTEKK